MKAVSHLVSLPSSRLLLWLGMSLQSAPGSVGTILILSCCRLFRDLVMWSSSCRLHERNRLCICDWGSEE